MLLGIVLALLALPAAIVGSCLIGMNLGAPGLGLLVGLGGIALWFALFAHLLRHGSRR